jgi:hypothetical protein
MARGPSRTLAALGVARGPVEAPPGARGAEGEPGPTSLPAGPQRPRSDGMTWLRRYPRTAVYVVAFATLADVLWRLS